MISARLISSVLLALGLLAAATEASAQAPAPPEQEPPETEEDRAPTRALEIAPREAEAPAAPAKTAKAARPVIAVVEAAPLPRDAAEAPAKPYLQQRFSLGLGFSGSIVENAGYDPYSKDNLLPMMTLFGTFTPWQTRPVSIHLAFSWDYGNSTAQARGNESSLDVHRLGLGLEARYMPISRMRLSVRGVPAAIHVDGGIQDPYLDKPLGASSWTWGVDVTGGAAARIGAVGDSDHPRVSFWVTLDVGYRFAGPTSMRLRPGDLGVDDQARKFGEVPMPDLDLSGFINRLSLSVSF